ncbi:transmembrane protein 214 [Gastrophryne carolinensis]
MAAAGDGKWKVVGKSKKAGEKRKALADNNSAPTLSSITAGVPVKSSIYQLGFEKIMKKQNKEQNKEQVPPSNALSDSQSNKKTPQQNGKTSKKQSSGGSVSPGQGKFPTVEEALRALDIGELKRGMEKSLTMFPENPQIWVKDLAGYLNFNLQTVKNDLLGMEQPYDYPYCLVSKELKSTIRNLLAKCSSVLDIFVDHCILLMLQELDRTTADSVHGYRICLQAVLLEKPKTVTLNLKKYLDMLRAQQNKPAKCLTIMWAVGQAGYMDLTEGLKVWLGLMLPVLGIKSLSPYAISYLDRLLLVHSNLTKGFGMIGPKDFFPLLDFAFMPNNSLTSSQQEQLRELYPRLKVLAFGATPENTLHTYFPSFLSRATPNCPPAMRKELLHSLYECLNLDPLSFSVWRQLYIKHLPQSSLLLQHLVDSWDTTCKPMRKSVRETVQSFCVTNEEFAAKPSHSKDISVCESVCQALLQKMKGRGFPWSRFLLIALVFLSGFVIHDVRTSGSFQASSSAKMLQQTGVLPVSQLAWTKMSYYTQQGYSWLEGNAPVYYAKAVDIMGPGLELVWEKTRDGAVYAAQICSTYVTYLKENLPGYLQWLHAQIPESVFQYLQYLQELLLHLYHNYLVPAVVYCEAALQRAWQQYVDSCNGKVTWDCTRDHLTSFTQSSWTFVQNTTLAIKDWAMAMMSNH